MCFGTDSSTRKAGKLQTQVRQEVEGGAAEAPPFSMMGRMTLIQSLRRFLGRLPLPVAAALGFAVFITAGYLVAFLIQPPRDLHAECRRQCEPRFSRVVPDKSYPMSAKGTYRQVCECY